MRRFPLHQVLMVTTGILLGEMKEVYEILSYMTGGSVWTHQIDRAIEASVSAILSQHPVLASVDASDCNTENVWDWLDKQQEKYPAEFELEPLADYEHRDPVEELVERVGEDRVITVKK